MVLELKFTNRFPDWFKDLVRVFGLTQCGAAKYAEGVELLGEHRLTHAFATNWVPAAKPAFLSEPSNVLSLVAAQGLAATFV